MKSHRVNLTLAEGDFQRLIEAARSEGKMAAAFAADVLKAYLLRSSFVGSQEPISKAAKPLLDRSEVDSGQDVFTGTLPGVPDPAGDALSRQERRALERKKQKKR